MITNQEILKIMEDYPRQYARKLKEWHPDVFDYINNHEFPMLNDYNFATKMYWHLHGLTDFPTYVCPVCGNEERLERNVFSVIDGYDRWMNRTGCCYQCSQMNPATKEKKCETFLSRFGVKHNSQIKGHAERCKAARQRMTEERRKLIQERRKNTCTEKYGEEHYSRTQEYGEKVRLANIKRFGVPYASQSDEIKNKIVETFMRNYGVKNSLQVDSVRQKINETCRKKYNADWYQQTNEYIIRKRHKFESKKFPGLKFDSNWEVMVYDFCREHGLDVEYSPNISYEYIYENVKHVYHPDFLIDGKCYEVKGDQFFKINESGNEIMVNPYRNPKWSDEHYKHVCGIYEAKHQCMLANNVIIIRGREIENLKGVFHNANT